MFDILYEDNQIIVVNKPQNIPSQEDSTKDLDMLTMVKNYIKEKYNKQGNVYIGLVHRLDRPTGGLMVFARTSKSAERLSKQIVDGEFKKQYLAVVDGVPRIKDGILVNYLKKDEKNNKVSICPQLEEGAKLAKLEYKIMDVYEDKYSLLKLSLFTGRSHQIRVQLSNIGNPIVSDVKYGSKSKITNKLSLWAYELSFVHPTTKQIMKFKSFPPIDEAPWKYFKIS